MLNAREFSHRLLQEVITPASIVIDATAGNGHDTLFLARLVPAGRVYAFDIQAAAIEQTRQRLARHALAWPAEPAAPVTLIHDSHARLDRHLPADEAVCAAIFNLGYLPGSDKSVITQGESTWRAVESIQARLRPGGRIAIVAYHGHDGGADEMALLQRRLAALDARQWQVLQYQFINQPNCPPVCFGISKKAPERG